MRLRHGDILSAMHWHYACAVQGLTLVASLAVACNLAFSASCCCNLTRIACIPRAITAVMLYSAPPSKIDLGIYHKEGNICIQAAGPTQKKMSAFKQHNPHGKQCLHLSSTIHTEENVCVQAAQPTQKAMFAFKQHNPHRRQCL